MFRRPSSGSTSVFGLHEQRLVDRKGPGPGVSVQRGGTGATQAHACNADTSLRGGVAEFYTRWGNLEAYAMRSEQRISKKGWLSSNPLLSRLHVLVANYFSLNELLQEILVFDGSVKSPRLGQ